MWFNLAILLLGLGGGSAPARSGLDSSSHGESRPGDDSRMLQLDVSVDPTIIVPARSQETSPPPPHTATVRVTLTNVGTKDRRLLFGCPCFLGFEVESPEGTTNHPADFCIQTKAEVTLPPGGKETKELRWTARSFNGAYAPLPPGKYKVFGTMGKNLCVVHEGHAPMRTAPVVVEVRPAAN